MPIVPAKSALEPMMSYPMDVPTATADELVKKELHYQARLLEKDRILHDKEKQVQSLDRDIRTAKMEMKEMESNNKSMLTVVNEYEKMDHLFHLTIGYTYYRMH